MCGDFTDGSVLALEEETGQWTLPWQWESRHHGRGVSQDPAALAV
jgi:hypothetical protein